VPTSLTSLFGGGGAAGAGAAAVGGGVAVKAAALVAAGTVATGVGYEGAKRLDVIASKPPVAAQEARPVRASAPSSPRRHTRTVVPGAAKHTRTPAKERAEATPRKPATPPGQAKKPSAGRAQAAKPKTIRAHGPAIRPTARTEKAKATPVRHPKRKKPALAKKMKRHGKKPNGFAPLARP
jgi:hypothetical protein